MLTTRERTADAVLQTDLWIDNRNVEGEGAPLTVICPATGEKVVTFQGASVAQVDAAVCAAARAFATGGDWSCPDFRAKVLTRFADLMVAQRDALMETLYSEISSPWNLQANHIDTPAAFARWFAQTAIQDRTRQLGLNAAGTAVSQVVYRPAGVIAAITAFNYPLLIGVTKSAAALAAGCTVVLLSSPQAPLAVAQLAGLIRDAGFPDGVFNVISGGGEVGQALTQHPLIDKVSFTGSVDVGRKGLCLNLCGGGAAFLPSTVLARLGRTWRV